MARLSCLPSVFCWVPAAVSQSLMVLSRLAEARNLPSGEKARPVTPASCPSSVREARRAATSQNRIVVSILPEASVLPSGANAKAVTAAQSGPQACPGWRRRPCSRAGSRGRRRRSRQACHRARTPRTGPCRRGRPGRPARCPSPRPTAWRAYRAAGDECLAVGAERDGKNVAGMAPGIDAIRRQLFGPGDASHDLEYQQGRRQRHPDRDMAMHSGRRVMNPHPSSLPLIDDVPLPWKGLPPDREGDGDPEPPRRSSSVM